MKRFMIFTAAHPVIQLKTIAVLIVILFYVDVKKVFSSRIVIQYPLLGS